MINIIGELYSFTLLKLIDSVESEKFNRYKTLF